MVKNYITEIAKMLGIELEEEFMVSNKIAIFKISAKNGLMCKFKDDERWEYDALDLQALLLGDLEIVKLPWKPKFKEEYYYPNTYEQRVFFALWTGSTLGYAMYNLGMCYKTREEAEAHFTEDYKKLTGKELKK